MARGRDGDRRARRRDAVVKRNRRLLVDSLTQMDHQLTTMVIRKGDHFETVSAGDDELELERQRETDPFRPLVLVLLEQAREQMRQEKEKQIQRGQPDESACPKESC